MNCQCSILQILISWRKSWKAQADKLSQNVGKERVTRDKAQRTSDRLLAVLDYPPF